VHRQFRLERGSDLRGLLVFFNFETTLYLALVKLYPIGNHRWPIKWCKYVNELGS